MYYLRTRPAADPIKFTVDKTKLKNFGKSETNGVLTDKSINTKPLNGEVKQTKTPTNTNALIAKTASPSKAVPVIETTTNGSSSEIPDDTLSSNADLIESLKMACSLKNKENCLMCSS